MGDCKSPFILSSTFPSENVEQRQKNENLPFVNDISFLFLTVLFLELTVIQPEEIIKLA